MTSTIAHTIRTESVEQTVRLGRLLGESAAPNDVIALEGPLGAGKTYLTKGIAAGLGVSDTRTVNSPTFVIVNEYDGRLHMFHIDAYRLSGAPELTGLGFDEMCSADGLVVIEWADRIRELLPRDRLLIELTPTGENSREFALSSSGPASEKLISSVRSHHG